MSTNDILVSILEAESEKPRNCPNGHEGLSAWSEETAKDLTSRRISTADTMHPIRPTIKSNRKSPRFLYSQSKTIKQTNVKPESNKVSTQVFNKASMSFTTYINSLIAKNSQLIKRFEYPQRSSESPKKLEVISIKLLSIHEPKRMKSFSPEKTCKIKTTKVLEDSFLIHHKLPPSVAGCSMTFYNKTNRPKSKTFSRELTKY